MDENKKIREVRVVGYSRELLFLQLTILVCIFSLLAVAISGDWWWRTLFVVCFLCLFGFSLFQASRLHRKGVIISICDLSEPEDALVCDEEYQDITSDEIDTDEDIESGENGDSPDQPHWTDSSYPDPDVELGLKNPFPAGDGQSARNENSDIKGESPEDDPPK